MPSAKKLADWLEKVEALPDTLEEAPDDIKGNKKSLWLQ